MSKYQKNTVYKYHQKSPKKPIMVSRTPPALQGGSELKNEECKIAFRVG